MKKLHGLGPLIGMIVGLAIGIGIVAWMRIDPSGQQGSGFDYDLASYQKIDPALVQYEQKATIPTQMREPRAMAVGLDDRIFVAGDKAIRVFAPNGAPLKEISLGQEPHCLTVGNAEHKFPGQIYVGMRDHVEVLSAAGQHEAIWDRSPGKRTALVSIAAAEEDVFVADAGSPVVWRYDLQGTLLGRIGQRDAEREIGGFVVPSPYFDVAIAPDGLLRVVNPGLHRIEAYTFDGHLEVSWGKRGIGIEAFCGCCNPANIAIFSDGRVVTAEKGIPRVKVYGATGEFECVVVGPDVLAPNRLSTVESREDLRLHPVDVAVDSHGRILVLDPSANCVRIFDPKPLAISPLSLWERVRVRAAQEKAFHFDSPYRLQPSPLAPLPKGEGTSDLHFAAAQVSP